MIKAVGLITEYNPFHNGHLHHLRQSRGLSGAEVAVAVMSGHFLQRGEPALVDKWVRARMALQAGVDLVVELPFPFACNSAPHFATGAVRALEGVGGVTDLCFGSESGELETLRRCASLLLECEKEVLDRTAAMLRKGVNYPASRAAVVAEVGGEEFEPLTTPNDILAIEYLKALRITRSAILPHAVTRIGAGYHQEEAVEGIASATGIRKMIAAGADITPFVPEAVRATLSAALACGRHADVELLHRLLLGRILQGARSLEGLYLVADGLENRLYAAALESRGWEGLVESVKGRQFTRTRVQRTLCHILAQTVREDMTAFLETGPLYLHLLAAGPRGRAFLAATRKDRPLPLLADVSRAIPALKRRYGAATERFSLAQTMLQADLRATRLYTLLMREWEGNRNRDYFETLAEL